MTKPPATSPKRLVVFLGAGFSCVAGAPLASQLFDEVPEVDRITRRRLIERVQSRWQTWHAKTGGSAEEHLAHLASQNAGDYSDAVWYVGLVVALSMGQLESVGAQGLTITRHNIDRTTQVRAHEDFWTAIFRRFEHVAVVTTNYDVLAERGLRVAARPRVPRLGFHYGTGSELLAGGGYPAYAHIQTVVATGAVPLLKLHGSISWSARTGEVVRYHDCRPAIRGDALIVAPVPGKAPPRLLRSTWELAKSEIEQAEILLAVGYSLPSYDTTVLDLLASASQAADVLVVDPDSTVQSRYEAVLGRAVTLVPGLPHGQDDLAAELTRLQ